MAMASCRRASQSHSARASTPAQATALGSPGVGVLSVVTPSSLLNRSAYPVPAPAPVSCSCSCSCSCACSCSYPCCVSSTATEGRSDGRPENQPLRCPTAPTVLNYCRARTSLKQLVDRVCPEPGHECKTRHAGRRQRPEVSFAEAAVTSALRGIWGRATTASTGARRSFPR